jgi:hypothetical protein
MGTKNNVRPIMAHLAPPRPPARALAAVKARAVAAGYKPTAKPVTPPSRGGVTGPGRGTLAPQPGSTASSRGGGAGPGRGTPSKSAVLTKAFGPPHPQRPPVKAPPPVKAGPWPRYSDPPELRAQRAALAAATPAPKFVPTVKLDASQITDRRLEPRFRRPTLPPGSRSGKSPPRRRRLTLPPGSRSQ